MSDSKKRIAVIYEPWLDDLPQLMRGIERACRDQGDLIATAWPVGATLGPSPALEYWSPDAVVACTSMDPPIYDWLRTLDRPVVNTTMLADLPTVAHCGEEQADIALEYAKHGRFASVLFLIGRDHDLRGQADRWRGRMPARGFPPHVARLACLAGDRPQPDVETELAAFLQDMPKPLLVIGYCDWEAAHALRLCQHLKLDVPREVSIVGAGDYAFAAMTRPPLSTVKFSFEDLGGAAIERVCDALSTGKQLSSQDLMPIRGARLVLRGTTPKEDGTRGIVAGVVADIRGLVERGDSDSLKVGDIAARHGVSVRTLRRWFQTELNMSPGDVTRHTKIDFAKHLLVTTDLSVTEIAGRCGFNSLGRFNDAFRRVAGVVPTEYRRTSSIRRHLD